MTRTITRRELRLGSGLVMLGYISAHLVNHALGLVSVPLAERGLALAVSVWHSVPGTLLLCAAITIHVVLAFDALYQRRTLRMPPLEVLRIALGLGIPLLLIGHVVYTRMAWELYGAAPRYARIVWGLWTSDGEGRQLAMLVPGWLHGCLGVNFAFGRRPLYQRLRLPLFALALLLPVLGELGFLAMGKELAADLASHGQLDAMIQVEPAAGLALARLRDAVLALYFVAIGLVFAAREVRAWTERRRKLLVQINYPLRRVRVPRGWTVLEASRSHRLPHLSMCGGRGRCTTCRVRVTEGALHCPPPEPAERNALERIAAAGDVRLACQLWPTRDIGVLPLLDPERTAWPLPKAPSAAERDLALLAVAWRNRAAFAASHLPQDLVFASQSFAEAATAAARAAHGTIVEARGDSVLAAFGQTGSLEMACRHGLAAAESVARALAALSERHTSAFGVAMDWAVVLHAGRTTIGPLGAHGGLVVAGDALDCVQRLLIAEAESALIVSATVLGHAGVATDPATDPATWREIDGVKVRLRPEPALDRDGGAMGQNRAMPNLRPPAT